MLMILVQMFSDIKFFLKSKPKDIKYIALDDQDLNK